MSGRTQPDNSGPGAFSGATFAAGAVIGRTYEVLDVLGTGAYTDTYLVSDRDAGDIRVLKALNDRHLGDAGTREWFRRQADLWVGLDRHAYLVKARLADEVAGRPFVVVEHVAPDEHGINTLEGYLQRRPPDRIQSLRWAIQFCRGMEYASSQGIRYHGNIKPANILIAQDNAVRITDFGLHAPPGSGRATPDTTDAASDERADICAFGSILLQLAEAERPPSGGSLHPDVPADKPKLRWLGIRRLQARTHAGRVKSPLLPVIHRCLQQQPSKRYQDFSELEQALLLLLRNESGDTVRPPDADALAAWEWNNRGANLSGLGRHHEAIDCFDKALELNPRDAAAWNNKGNALNRLGFWDEAADCYDRALAAAPQNPTFWRNRGAILNDLGRYREAARCFDEASEIEPGQAANWSGKGDSLNGLGRHGEAIHYFDRALTLDPRYAAAWKGKAVSLDAMGRPEEAAGSRDKATELGADAVPARRRESSRYDAGRAAEAARPSQEPPEPEPADDSLPPAPSEEADRAVAEVTEPEPADDSPELVRSEEPVRAAEATVEPEPGDVVASPAAEDDSRQPLSSEDVAPFSEPAAEPELNAVTPPGGT